MSRRLLGQLEIASMQLGSGRGMIMWYYSFNAYFLPAILLIVSYFNARNLHAKESRIQNLTYTWYLMETTWTASWSAPTGCFSVSFCWINTQWYRHQEHRRPIFQLSRGLLQDLMKKASRKPKCWSMVCLDVNTDVHLSNKMILRSIRWAPKWSNFCQMIASNCDKHMHLLVYGTTCSFVWYSH